MADDDKELWDSANEATVTEQPEVEAASEPEKPEEKAENRDERGRFAPKAEQAETPKVEQPAQEKQEQGIPPWRLREEAEGRRAAEERASQRERELEQFRHELAELRKQNEPKPVIPDIFEDSGAFVDHRTREAIDPVKSEMAQLREFYSQRDAVRTHGAEAVKEAFNSLDQAARSGDPEARAAVERVKASMDPFGDMVTWHKKQTIFSTIGSDPDAYVEKQLEEKLKDPAYQAKLLERIRGQAQARPSTVTQLPPSLSRVTSAATSSADGDDDSEAGLYRSATRR